MCARTRQGMTLVYSTRCVAAVFSLSLYRGPGCSGHWASGSVCRETSGGRECRAEGRSYYSLHLAVCSPPSSLQELLLVTLHWCFQVDTAQGLECGTIPSSLPLLTHPSPLVRGRAATLIYDLTTPYPGKEEACSQEGCVEALVKLLRDEDGFVRSQASAALMR